MSQSFISSSTFMKLIDLNELNEPHKLAKWFTILPKYKKCYLQSLSTQNNINIININNKPSSLTPINSNIDDQDINICQSLSKFVYQNQICGKHLKYNFNENQFKTILNTIFDNNANYNFSECEWIWDIIKLSQQINNNIEQSIYKRNTPKIYWILSTWDQFQLIQQDEVYHNPSYNNNKQNITKPQSKSPQTKSQNGKYNTEHKYETKEVEYDGNDDHDTNHMETSRSEHHPIPMFKQLDNNSNDQDAEFVPTPIVHSDDKLDHPDDHDEQYEQEIADETDRFLIKTDRDSDGDHNEQQEKQIKAAKRKGNRQRLGTESMTESDELDWGKNFVKDKKDKQRKKNNKIYNTINEQEHDTDMDHDHNYNNDRTEGRVITPNGTQTNFRREEQAPKGGLCNGCVIL